MRSARPRRLWRLHRFSRKNRRRPHTLIAQRSVEQIPLLPQLLHHLPDHFTGAISTGGLKIGKVRRTPIDPLSAMQYQRW